MGGTIKYSFAIDGIDKEILKTRSLSQALRDVDKISSTLGRNASTVFGNASSGNSNKLGLFQGRPGFKELNPDLFKKTGEQSGKAFGEGVKKGIASTPPVIQTPAWKNFLAGGLSMANGNQYLAARSFMGAFGIGGGGGAGGGRGSLGLGGGAGGNFLPAAIALTAVKVASEAVRVAFDQMVQAVQRGSKLFLDSAKIGTGQGELAHVRNALGLVGVDESDADRLLLTGQFGSRRRGSGASGQQSRGGATSFFGDLLGTRGAPAQLGQLQQITNLQKEALMAWKDTAAAAVGSGLAARQLFETTFNFKELVINVKAYFEELAALIAIIVKPIIAMVNELAKLEVGKLALVLKALQLTGVIPEGEAFKKTGAIGQRIPVNQFERLGFSFGGGQGVDTGRRIADNTGKMVMLLGRLVGYTAGQASRAMQQDVSPMSP